MKVLAAAERDAHAVAAGLRPEDLTIRGIWRNQYWLRLTDESSLLALQYLLVQTTRQGVCYFDGPDLTASANLIGKSALAVRGVRALRVAALDAVLLADGSGAESEHEWTGGPSAKAALRARCVFDQVASVVTRRGLTSPRVCVVGVVGEIVAHLVSERGWSIHATDFAPDLVGKRVHGVEVRHGSHTLEEVTRADVALVTGMTIGNGSCDPILDVARHTGTDIVMFCQTGAGFGRTLVKMGVRSAVCEEHPFYLCGGGVSLARIYRAV